MGASLLDEIVRDGARQMLAAALQAEVAAYIEAHVTRSTRTVAGWWSATGIHAEREVTTAAGAVPVRQPRVNDKRVDEATGERKRFSSAILPAWARKSPQVSGGVAAAVPARPVHRRLRAGAGAVPRLESRACRRPRSPG